MNNKIGIPKHVIKPSLADYRTTTNCQEMNRSGRGYAILRALGAHERLSDKAIETVIAWTNEFHKQNNKITPHTESLMADLKEGISLVAWFKKRLGPDFSADKAAYNAAAYKGDKSTLSYKMIFEQVWIEQKWPLLCRALSEQAATLCISS